MLSISRATKEREIMVQLPDILTLLTIPDPDAFRQLSSHFQDWGNQHRDHLLQLDNGHSNLKGSWQGDGADAYSQLHSLVQQAGSDHLDQALQASLIHIGTVALLETAQVMQDIALAELAGAGIEFILGFFTAGATDVLAAPEVADAVANEAVAQGEAQGARLLFQNGFKALMGIIEGWKDHKVLFEMGGALLGGASGLTYGITHHESLAQITETTLMDSQMGFEAGKNLSSDNPVTAIKELGGIGIGTFQYFASGDRGNEDPAATIFGMANLVAGGERKEPEGMPMGITDEGKPNALVSEQPNQGWGKGQIPCFPSGTIVSMPNGANPIENIRQGDCVYAYDFYARSIVIRRVLAVYHGTTNCWVDVSFCSSVLRTTQRHPIWVEAEQDWMEAARLAPGMKVRLQDGQILEVSGVTVLPQREMQETYNLTIEEVNNFFAGSSRILVHNANSGIDKPGYSNYVLIDKTGKVYYHGMFGPNETPASVQYRHSHNGDRFNPSQGDRMEVVPGTRTYGEARRMEHEGCVQDGTYIGQSEETYRGNRQYPMSENKFKKYYPPDAC